MSTRAPESDDRRGATGEPLSDGGGFADAYRDHHAAVAAVARKVCGPHHAADVAQDVFFGLCQHPEKFDPERGSLRSFLLTMAHHKAVDVVRSEVSRQAREERVDPSGPLPPADVDHKILREEGGARVRAALAELPTGERQAIITAFYGGCSYREAATRLGQPEGTVKSRIRIGLQRLRPALVS